VVSGGGCSPPEAITHQEKRPVPEHQASLTAVAPAVRRRAGASRLARRRRRAGILLSLPAIALVTVLLGLPIGQAVYYSLRTWNGVTSTWIGPSAYTTALTDPIFLRVLENNGLLLLAIPVAIGLPLGFATLLHEHVRGWRFFRSVYFLPTAVSWVVIGMVALQFFSATGKLNGLLASVGLGSVQTDMLAGEHSALIALAITFVYSMVGTNTIIFLTGMATLDPTLIEAAKVDGLNRRQIFIRITLPLLTRFIQFSFVITVISAFSALFSLIYVMTSGGPGLGTTTLEFFIYQTGFQQAQFGTGALYGIILFVIMAVVGLVQLRLIKPNDKDGW
jgi:ABC-type sugar transport system permease subunit